MSTFQKAVSKTVREYGTDIIGTVQFYGLLSDSGAFNDEKPAMRSIVRTLNSSSELRDMVRSGRTRSLTPSEVRSAIMVFSDRCGFDRDLVSHALVGILKGAGLLPSSFSLRQKTNHTPREEPPAPCYHSMNQNTNFCPPRVHYAYPSNPSYYSYGNSDWWKKAWSIIWKVGLVGLGIFLLIKYWWILLLIIVLIVVLCNIL